MQQYRSVAVVAGAALVVGYGLGAGLVSWPSARQVEALDSLVAEKVYAELASDRSPLLQGSDWLAKVASVTSPSVVHIQSQHRTAARGSVEETGSGVLMSSAKTPGVFVVTNRHVIQDAALADIEIALNDGRFLTPERVWTDAATDVAVMKISAPNVNPAKWGDSNQVEIGHMVLAMGSPFGLSRSVTFGIVSAKGRRSLRLGSADVINQDFIQTDAAINPGNSGGPLIDLQGRVVGINTAIASSGGGNEGIGFSIPSNLASRVVEELLEYGVVRRAYLGVKLDPTYDVRTARRLRLDRVRGSRVTEVYPNTPASRANLRIDDVVLQFDGVDVQDENHLINLVSLTPVGRRVRLLVWRDGREASIEISLADRTTLSQPSATPVE